MTVITFEVPPLKTITARDFMAFLAFLSLVYGRRPHVHYHPDEGLIVTVVCEEQLTEAGICIGAKWLGLEFQPI